jgi:hypothetical protein
MSEAKTEPFDWLPEGVWTTTDVHCAKRLARFLASATADEWLARRIDPEAWAKLDREIAHPTKVHKNKVPWSWIDYYSRACDPSLARAREIRLGLDDIAKGGEER